MASEHGDVLVQDLLQKEILVEEGTEANARDERLRAANWRPASAVMHYASRWHGVDTAEAEQRSVDTFGSDLMERLGPAPPPVAERGQADARRALPGVPPTALDALLDRRVTCRNFDQERAIDEAQLAAVLHRSFGARAVDAYAPGLDILKKTVPSAVRERASRDERVALPVPELGSPLDRLLDSRVTCRNFDTERRLGKNDFSAVLYRTYAARAVDDYAPGVQLLKKGVPSAGGLHPTEAYLLVRDVEGVPPGLYHYHPVEHALETLREMSREDVSILARRFVGAQPYLLGAHVFVIPVSRFYRNFWKYGNHAKAYRALILDIGHLSQTMYLAATELGLGAFFTAAVNEIDIEEAFGLDPLEEGPLAVTGFGIRAAERSEVEFDPLHAVWKD